MSAFVEAIWEWHRAHKRELPWRDLPDHDPKQRGYKILVSEVMLQQTQVSRVEIIFRSFLARFPMFQDLASASNRDVILAWRGMGYNGRALRLRDAAKMIVQRRSEEQAASSSDQAAPCSLLHATFPNSMEELQSIPGIGHYTAAAIRNFAFNIPTPCLDTNIRRILHRTFIGPENPDGTWKNDDAYLLKLAGEVLEIALSVPRSSFRVPRSAKETSNELTSSMQHSAEHAFSMQKSIQRTTANWHAALMDYGSLVQTKTNPKWNICPLTAKGIMKTTPQSHPNRGIGTFLSHGLKKEPGRFVGQKFVPNRIFRGKVVDALRDAPEGYTLDTLGREVCIDWEERVHQKWFSELLSKLVRDALVQKVESRYSLRE